jgi:hypothetical protein
MKRTNLLLVLALGSLWFLIAGCAGQTKPEIPDALPSLDAGKARIILTREKQLGGAGSPVIFLDIGENVSPNAMLYIEGESVKEILHKRDFATTSLTGLFGKELLLWADPATVNPLACGHFETGCIKYHWRWPKEGDGGFFYGTGLVITEDCKFYLGYMAPNRILKKIFNNEYRAIAYNEIPRCGSYKYRATVYEVPEVGGYYAFATAPEYVMALSGTEVWIGTSRYIQHTYEYVPIDDAEISRDIEVIGSAEVGDTLIWDRQPGIMRLGSAWWDGLGIMQENVVVEAGRTYYIHYTTGIGLRWEVTDVQ